MNETDELATEGLLNVEDRAAQAEFPPVSTEKPLPLWLNRDYMLLWGGQLVSTVGSTASGTVFPLLVLALTGSPAAAGIAGGLTLLPYALFSLPAGALIDRWDRKRVMIIADLLNVLVYASIPVAMLFNTLTVAHLYVAAFLAGTCFVFFNLSEVSALPRVVPKAQLPNAAAQNQATFAVAGIIGPSVGTFLYGTVARMSPFIFDAVSYLVSVISLTFIRSDFQRERVATRKSSLLSEIKEGVSWLWSQPLLRFMALSGGGVNLLLASNALAVILLAKDLGASDTVIGTLFSIGSVGGLVGAVFAARLLKRLGLGVTLIGGMWAIAFIYPLYVLAPNLIALGLVVGLLFAVIPVLSVATFSYRSALVPDELQGRVNSAFRLVSWGSQPVGSLLGGILLEQIGVVSTMLAFTAGWVALALITSLNAQVRGARPVNEATS